MSLITTGCRVNQSDASRIRARMDGLPVTFVAPGAAADVVVVNACTLTRDADRSARAAVRRGLRAGARTILAGCLAT
ncbi:MAG TPA: tRNA (N(6)-L-threonylcarbamoyladenosine(37)-C(2))-methylthiotransferase MtaB, partial [Myxococcota bacterium]|nr:tRNA (N(6)-L-threonylcarbamoyladenosine(37)-C(2))-methylthiotransferase MtaB [Myxococcota bacterium]